MPPVAFVRFHPVAKSTTLLNWPMQAGSGDILRRAVHALHRDGVCVLATLHDAVLAECDEADMAECGDLVVSRMEQASRETLGGRTIPAEVSIRVRPGEQLFGDDDEGVKARAEWERMMALMGDEIG